MVTAKTKLMRGRERLHLGLDDTICYTEFMDLGDLRKKYPDTAISMESLPGSPYELLQTWLQTACEANLPEVNAMVLATSSAEGRPSSRTVLLKEFSESGCLFYTNYGSRKAQELEENPYTSATMLWLPLHRQVTFEGPVERVAQEISRAYFATRPRGSQLSAWASKQGEPLPDFDTLERNYKLAEKRFAGREVPRPDWWGGYRILPTRFEFWQGRANRLHSRVAYEKQARGWTISLLSP